MLILLGPVTQPCCAGQDKQEEKLGPKGEPAATGSDYQPLLWSGPDAEFAVETERSGSCQIATSGLVTAKSSNPDLQQPATRSVDLQEKNIKKLNSMAKVIDFKFPSKKRARTCPEAGDLSGRSGEDFDRAYLAYLSKANAADITRFQAEADSLPDSANFDLRKFISAALPALTDQQRSIAALARKLDGDERHVH